MKSTKEINADKIQQAKSIVSNRAKNSQSMLPGVSMTMILWMP